MRGGSLPAPALLGRWFPSAVRIQWGVQLWFPLNLALTALEVAMFVYSVMTPAPCKGLSLG